jgi:hypothetical protein
VTAPRWLLDAWARANTRWFDGRLRPPVIVIEPIDRWFVLADTKPGRVTRLRFSPVLLDLPRLADDLLVHEMAHQYLIECDRRPNIHHDLAFAVQVNCIGRAVGMPLVLSTDTATLERWPQTLRPPGYYERSAA